MKKLEEPIVKVVKFKAMDVIATSGETTYKATGLQGFTNGGSINDGNGWILQE